MHAFERTEGLPYLIGEIIPTFVEFNNSLGFINWLILIIFEKNLHTQATINVTVQRCNSPLLDAHDIDIWELALKKK